MSPIWSREVWPKKHLTITPTSELSRTYCNCLHLAVHIITQLRCRHLVLTIGAPSKNSNFVTSMRTSTTPEMVGSYTVFDTQTSYRYCVPWIGKQSYRTTLFLCDNLSDRNCLRCNIVTSYYSAMTGPYKNVFAIRSVSNTRMLPVLSPQLTSVSSEKEKQPYGTAQSHLVVRGECSKTYISLKGLDVLRA